MTALRVITHGGGVQSTALLVLSAQGKIDFPTHLFSNVGDDSENPLTLAYVNDVSIPYAEANGVQLVETRRTQRDGSPAPTLWQDTMLGSKRSISIPVRMPNGAPGRRKCTSTKPGRRGGGTTRKCLRALPRWRTS